MLRALLILGIAVSPMPMVAQTTTLSAEVRRYIAVDAPVIVLQHARVIDGTGAPERPNQTLVITDGRIAQVGDAATVTAPAGAKILDMTDETVMPGLVMVHEHMFYPTGGGVAIYNEHGYSFPRLYLAGGATTIRTAGSMEPYTDLNIKRMIDSGAVPGPAIDVTGPYLEGPGLPLYQVHPLTSADDATEMVRFWADRGATSFKMYMNITRAEMAAVLAEAHKRGLLATGHLCSVTFREAATLGIDNLEHGLVVSTDFVPDKKPDVCPKSQAVQASIAALDVTGDSATSLIRFLVSRHVALTSTLAIFETFVRHRPPIWPRVLEAMTPEARSSYLQGRLRVAEDTASPWPVLFRKEMQFERAFAAAGGLLLSGSDPTGYGGVVPGYSNQREIELLVESGFTPVEAIRISTLNGAQYLKQADRIGSIAKGKRADLLIVRGDPGARIADIENANLVFKDGVAYDAQRLFDSARGTVGLH
jgi:imidazolonepropionase-like amidohydrolase